MNEREKKIKKLKYQAWYRGCKETDKILGPFAREFLDDFSDKEMLEFEQILEFQDVDIYDWLSGKKPTPEDVQANSVFRKITEYRPASKAIENDA